MPRIPPNQRKHGHSFVNGRSTPEYAAWASMKHRCSNPNSPQYKNYGARGITVCKRWQESFEAFLADMGPRPSPQHSLDRYPDNDGNYEPGNCRWATPREQGRNRRTNHFVEFRGERFTVTEAAEKAGVDIVLVRSRLKHGWTIERALS